MNLQIELRLLTVQIRDDYLFAHFLADRDRAFLELHRTGFGCRALVGIDRRKSSRSHVSSQVFGQLVAAIKAV